MGIPTETVYGLGANGLDPEAVSRIFQAKGRPPISPISRWSRVGSGLVGPPSSAPWTKSKTPGK